MTKQHVREGGPRPWLAERREALGLKQDEVAAHVGVRRSQISAWENGHQAPGADNVIALADILGRSPHWVMTGDAGKGHFVVRGTGDVDYDPNPDPEGSPAEQLMAFLGQRVGMRRVAGSLTSKDLIAVAYTIAREEKFGPDEFKKIDRWRDEIMATERGAPD